MTEPLSPAANAAWQAFNEVAERVGVFEDYGDALAAALRAVAHHLQRCSPWPNDAEGIGIDWSTSELHDIAAELES